MQSVMSETITVIVPVYNGRDDLHACLAAIRASVHPPDELIVVDDGSTDGAPDVARQFGARVLSSGGVRQGPAKARNVGARDAQGSILFFLDADVCVDPTAIGRVAEAFTQDPGLAAIMGSYDADPHHPQFFSQYKNLQHCFVHHNGKRQATTFWTGCGAMRRAIFFAHGGFDAETYARPSIEDIELGYRLTRRGDRIALDPGIQVKHRKLWTFEGLVRTDFFDRALPWTALILRAGKLPNDLNLAAAQRLSAALACLLAVWILVSVWFAGPACPGAWLALIHAMLGYFWAQPDSAHPVRKWLVNLGLGAVAALLTGFIPFAVTGLLYRFLPAILAGLLSLLGMAAPIWFLREHPANWAALGAMLTLAMLNRRFYSFLSARRGWRFSLAAMPVHWLYYLYSTLGFVLGHIRHRLQKSA